MSTRATLYTLLVIVIWASNFIVIKIGVNAIEPLALLGMRFFFAGLIFSPFFKWPGWKQARMIMLAGFLMGPLHQGLLYIALVDIPANLVSIIMQSNVLMVTLIGWFFLKEKIGWRTWSGILIGLIGIFILVGGSNLSGNFIGLTYTLISAFFIALTYIAMKKVDHVHAPTYIVLMCLPISPFIFLSSIAVEGTDWWSTLPDLNWTIITAVVLYQAIILSLSHMLWQRLLARYPVSQVAPWTLLIPVVAVIFAMIFLDEPLTKAIIIGGGLTIVGVAITTFRRLEKSKSVPTEL